MQAGVNQERVDTDHAESAAALSAGLTKSCAEAMVKKFREHAATGQARAERLEWTVVAAVVVVAALVVERILN